MRVYKARLELEGRGDRPELHCQGIPARMAPASAVHLRVAAQPVLRTLPQIGTLLAGDRLDSGGQLRGFLASPHGRPVLFCIWYLELAFIPQLT